MQDKDSLLVQLKDGVLDDVQVIYVASLKIEVTGSEQDVNS